MNKTDLIRRVAKTCNVSIEDTSRWVNAIFDVLTDCILENEEVHIYGFGRFNHRRRKAYVGSLPSREAINIPAKTKLRFTPGVYFADAINDGITPDEYRERLEKIRAIRRGEHVPGYVVRKNRLVSIEEVAADESEEKFLDPKYIIYENEQDEIADFDLDEFLEGLDDEFLEC